MPHVATVSPVPISVAVIGLGTVGRAVAAAVAHDAGMRLVAGVDLDVKKLARFRGDHAETVVVTDEIDELDAIDVAVVCTGPHFERLAPTLRQLMRKKAHVVSDCAEMAWPWLRHPHLADVIAGEARKAGVALVGTGIHPGIVSATLPLTLASMTPGVRTIRVTQAVDLNRCRPSTRRRAGVGLTAKQFRTMVAEGRVGALGSGEAVVLVAQGLGRHPTQSEVRTISRPIFGEPGEDGVARVTGIYQTAVYAGGGIEIDIGLTMSTAPITTRDEIEINDASVELDLPGGLADAAAAAVLVNVARVLPRVPAGLRTVLDLPPTGGR